MADTERKVYNRTERLGLIDKDGKPKAPAKPKAKPKAKTPKAGDGS